MALSPLPRREAFLTELGCVWALIPEKRPLLVAPAIEAQPGIENLAVDRVAATWPM